MIDCKHTEFVQAIKPQYYVSCLGMYFGDGCISKCPRTYHLRIFQDAQYTNLVEKQVFLLEKLLPSNKVSFHTRVNCTTISVYSNKLPHLFPQHGPGPKHLRNLALTKIQEKLVEQYPKEFLWGLWITDGSRYLTRIKKSDKIYEYPTYAFKNKSKQLRTMFIESCQRLDLKPTSNREIVTCYKRKDVRKLEGILGVKT